MNYSQACSIVSTEQLSFISILLEICLFCIRTALTTIWLCVCVLSRNIVCLYAEIDCILLYNKTDILHKSCSVVCSWFFTQCNKFSVSFLIIVGKLIALPAIWFIKKNKNSAKRKKNTFIHKLVKYGGSPIRWPVIRNLAFCPDTQIYTCSRKISSENKWNE